MDLLKGLKVSISEHKHMPLHEEYTTILYLAHRLEKEKIPYDLHRCWDGWQICFEYNGNCADIIEHEGSYGHEKNLMESMGFVEDEDDITGDLEVEDAMIMIYNFFKK